MILPPDVVDYIFSFLQADIATLGSCTQAHPLLSSLAERHIYRTITLNIKPDLDFKISQLSSLLEKNSHIRNYIRSLVINVNDYLPLTKAISSILSSLPSLNQVKLTLRKVVWFHTQETFRSAFINILQQPSVKEVHLVSIFAFPLPILNTCQNIKSLSLLECSGFERLESTPPSHHLESLSILSCGLNGFHWAFNHIGSLNSLKLNPNSMEFSGLPRLFGACARSLTTLELVMYHLEEGPYSDLFPANDLPFTLSVLSNLQHLTIQTVIVADQEIFDGKKIYQDFAIYSAIRAIVRLIERSAPSLRQVVLKIFCYDFSDINSLAKVDWDPILTFGDSPTCPHIDLCISIQEIETSLEEISRTLARTKLIRLVNMGVLTIETETADHISYLGRTKLAYEI